MKRQLTIAATAFLSVAALQAQNIVDAVRFSSTDISGTARYRSMAGAFGALGGDPSCMSDNPAGLAIYRGTNLFSFTPNLTLTDTHSKGTWSVNEDRQNASMSNMSAIFSFRTESDNLVNFTMGVGFERKFQKHSKYTTGNSFNFTPGNEPLGFGSYLTNQANFYLDGNIVAEYGLGLDNVAQSNAPFLSILAWDSYAIDVHPKNPRVVVDPICEYPSPHRKSYGDVVDNVYQTLFVEEDTRLDQYNISGAFNFNDMLYAGVTFNISDFSSTIRSQFSEDYSPNGDKSYIDYDNDLETKASGIGINLGLLWMPIDNWRVGVAIHTPTWYDMDEHSNGYMTCDDDRLDSEMLRWSDLYDSWKYCLNTPWEYQFSTAYIIGTRGLISLEYDLRDFSSLRYKSNSAFTVSRGFFDDPNTSVKDYLIKQHTLKIGGEYRINRQWSARAGYAFVSSPFKDCARRGYIVTHTDNGICNDEVNWKNYSDKEYTNIQNLLYYNILKPNYQTVDKQHYFTCGAGWRGKQWYVDAAFMYHITGLTACAYPDDFSYTDPIDVDLKEKSFDLTVGYRF